MNLVQCVWLELRVQKRIPEGLLEPDLGGVGGLSCIQGEICRKGLQHPLALGMVPFEFLYLLTVPYWTPCWTMLCLSRQLQGAYCMPNP